ncbi:hypothetical protein ACHAW6_004456 [Cyclotella cf. meneghiniana]
MPPQHIDQTDLLAELVSHNEFFDSIVNMIPANLYVAGHSGNDAYHSKYLKGQNKESKEAKRARNKIAKREKFDPEKVETTLQTKKRLQREQEDEDDRDDGNDRVVFEEDDGDDGENDADQKHLNKKSSRNKNTTTDNKSYASRIETLRAKLHAKMAQKRVASGISEGDNGAAPLTSTTSPTLVSKRAARRAEKRKRQEAAKQRKKSAPASSSGQDKSDPQRVMNLGGSKFNEPTSSKMAPEVSAADDLANIDYQSLAGLKPKLDPKFDDKSLNPKVKKKSLEKLLADAERKQQRLKELKQSSLEEDKEKAKNLEWGEALKVAGGANVRKTNDPKLLKKALKRKAKKKAASAKAWGARLDQAKEAQNKKQQIRSHNLESRKLGGAVGANLSSKRIVEKDEDGKEKEGEKGKRRRMGPHSGQGVNRAGFEGKKQGFINGDSSGGGAKGKQ